MRPRTTHALGSGRATKQNATVYHGKNTGQALPVPSACADEGITWPAIAPKAHPHPRGTSCAAQPSVQQLRTAALPPPDAASSRR